MKRENNRYLEMIGKKYSTRLYILHPVFITCIGMIAHKIGIYEIYIFTAPIVVCMATLIFLIVAEKIKKQLKKAVERR